MKRVIKSIIVIIIISILGAFLLIAVSDNTEGKSSITTLNGNFTVIEEIINLNCKIVYHNESKVMYAVSNGHYNSGTFTRLDNADGTPMLYEGEEINE